MVARDFKNKNKTDFAERCRIAIEKSYGMSVPKPNCLSNKQRLTRKMR
jgi:hypothetical protein